MTNMPTAASLSAEMPDEDQFLTNHRGFQVAMKNISPATLMEDQVVKNLIARAQEISRLLTAFRADAFEEVDTFLGILAEKYGAKPRSGANTALQDFSEQMKVEVSTGNFLALGPELQAAKSLIDECLEQWSEGANEHLRAIVNDAFDVNSDGKLKVDRILALRRVQIEDPTWQRAMSALSDAIRVTRSKRYVRFHVRANMDAPWQQIALDLARVS